MKAKLVTTKRSQQPTDPRTLDVVTVDGKAKFPNIMHIALSVSRDGLYADVTQADSFELRMIRNGMDLWRFDSIAIGSIVFPVREWAVQDYERDRIVIPFDLEEDAG
jgi:hypothetical protein